MGTAILQSHIFVGHALMDFFASSYSSAFFSLDLSQKERTSTKALESTKTKSNHRPCGRHTIMYLGIHTPTATNGQRSAKDMTK
jgi:hypothetical protein